MTLQIIGAGFGRTGTNSLKVALDILGFKPCYHMFEVKDNPKHVEFWNSAFQNRSTDWTHFFKDYVAAVDWPAAAIEKEVRWSVISLQGQEVARGTTALGNIDLRHLPAATYLLRTQDGAGQWQVAERIVIQ